MATDSNGVLLERVKRFFFLQTERVETYTFFEEGFTAYLKGAPNYNFELYKKLVNEITNTFQKISAEVVAIGQLLTANNRIDLSQSIQKIQQLEEQKLQHTAELQMTRQKQVDEPQADLEESVTDYQSKLAQAVEDINDEMESLKFNAEDLYMAADT